MQNAAGRKSGRQRLIKLNPEGLGVFNAKYID